MPAVVAERGAEYAKKLELFLTRGILKKVYPIPTYKHVCAFVAQVFYRFKPTFPINLCGVRRAFLIKCEYEAKVTKGRKVKLKQTDVDFKGGK